MPRCPIQVLALVITVLSGNPSLALEPTLTAGTVKTWSSVQGHVTGNRVASFHGNLDGATVLREKFLDKPLWIVSGDLDDDGKSEAAVQFSDGTMRVLSVNDGRIRSIAESRGLAPRSPPVILSSIGGEPTGGLVGMDDKGDLVTIDFGTGRQRRLAGGFSTLSHPLAADLDGDGEQEIAAVSREGFLTVVKGRIQTRSDKAVALLPDTRITAADMDGDGSLEILALSRPASGTLSGSVNRGLKARGVAVFEWNGRFLRLKSAFDLEDGQFFQAPTPLVAGPDEAGDPLLLLPVEEEKNGAQIRSYSYRGGRVREKRKGPLFREVREIAILGSSPLGEGDGTYLLAAVITDGPQGDLELYRMDLAQTRITLARALGEGPSRSGIVEDSLIGDMNGDGGMDLLAPGRGMSSLVIFSLDRGRLTTKEVFRSSGKIATNLCPGDFDGDGLSDVAFGLDDGDLVILLGE